MFKSLVLFVSVLLNGAYSDKDESTASEYENDLIARNFVATIDVKIFISCKGAIVSSREIITAASCLYNVLDLAYPWANASEIVVSLENSKDTYEVASYDAGEFNGNPHFGANMAILKLKEPIKFGGERQPLKVCMGELGRRNVNKQKIALDEKNHANELPGPFCGDNYDLKHSLNSFVCLGLLTENTLDKESLVEQGSPLYLENQWTKKADCLYAIKTDSLGLKVTRWTGARLLVATRTFYFARKMSLKLPPYSQQSQRGKVVSSPANYPFFVQLIPKKRKPLLPRCGGAIISKSTILTAAACLYSNNTWIDPAEVTIVSGTNSFSQPDSSLNTWQKHRVEGYLYSTNYYPGKMGFGLIVVTVSPLIEFDDYRQPGPVCEEEMKQNMFNYRLVTFVMGSQDSISDADRSMLIEIEVIEAAQQNEHISIRKIGQGSDKEYSVLKDSQIALMHNEKTPKLCSGVTGNPVVLVDRMGLFACVYGMLPFDSHARLGKDEQCTDLNIMPTVAEHVPTHMELFNLQSQLKYPYAYKTNGSTPMPEPEEKEHITTDPWEKTSTKQPTPFKTREATTPTTVSKTTAATKAKQTTRSKNEATSSAPVSEDKGATKKGANLASRPIRFSMVWLLTLSFHPFF